MPYPTTPCLFEDLFAIGSVHILAGMSGSGKTRFAFQMIEEIEQKGTFLKSPSLLPISACYFAFDRALSSIHRTLNSMKCELKAPIASLYEQARIVEELRIPGPDKVKGHNLVIIDGLDCIINKLIDARDVARVLHQCSQLAISSEVAILGIVGTAKVKNGEGYEQPRERLIGSSYWARLSEDIILISPSENGNKHDRIVDILPRNSAPLQIDITFEGGRLVSEETAIPNQRDLAVYAALPDSFSTDEAEEVAEDLKISRASMFRSLKRLCKHRLIEKVQHGRYLKVKPN